MSKEQAEEMFEDMFPGADVDMYVLTNESKINGAIWLTNQDALEMVSEKLGGRLRSIYRIAAAVMIVLMFVLLATAMLGMPEIGDKNNPDNNEVARRYIENGLDETGAVNIVSGMILDYRAFDTFGESCVLFVATICVTIMLRIDGRGGAGDDEETESSKKAFRICKA